MITDLLGTGNIVHRVIPVTDDRNGYVAVQQFCTVTS